MIEGRLSSNNGLWKLQAKWAQGLLTKEQAITEIVKTGKSREIANKILDSWGYSFSGYTPLYSGKSNVILSAETWGSIVKEFETALKGSLNDGISSDLIGVEEMEDGSVLVMVNLKKQKMGQHITFRIWKDGGKLKATQEISNG